MWPVLNCILKSAFTFSFTFYCNWNCLWPKFLVWEVLLLSVTTVSDQVLEKNFYFLSQLKLTLIWVSDKCFYCLLKLKPSLTWVQADSASILHASRSSEAFLSAPSASFASSRAFSFSASALDLSFSASPLFFSAWSFCLSAFKALFLMSSASSLTDLKSDSTNFLSLSRLLSIFRMFFLFLSDCPETFSSLKQKGKKYFKNGHWKWYECGKVNKYYGLTKFDWYSSQIQCTQKSQCYHLNWWTEGQSCNWLVSRTLKIAQIFFFSYQSKNKQPTKKVRTPTFLYLKSPHHQFCWCPSSQNHNWSSFHLWFCPFLFSGFLSALSSCN